MTRELPSHSILQEIKNNLSLSLPLMFAWIIYSLGPFAGTAMIAHLGKDILAASVLVGTIWIAGITFFFGIFHSVSVLIAHQRGADQHGAVGEIMGQAYILNILFWIPLIILMWLVPYIVYWSAPSADILRYATDYAHALSLAAPGMISLAIFEHFLSGIGKTNISLLLSLIEIPIEIVFIYVFVFGKLGLPAFGITGVGYGLALSYTLTTIFVVIALKFTQFAKRYEIFKYVGKFDLHYCKEMLRIGLPIGFTYFIELVAFTVATYFISNFHATALAAHQIIMQFGTVFINIPYALSQAISIRVGLSVGAQDKTGVFYASYVGIGIGAFLAVLILLLLISLPTWLLSIDLNVQALNNQELVNLSVSLFLILGIYQLFDSIRVLEAGALRGLKDTNFTLLVNVLCFLLFGSAAAYMLGIILNGNVKGVWYGLTIGIAMSAALLTWRLQTILKRMNLWEIVQIKGK